MIATLEADQRRAEQGDLLRTLIHMDDPDHHAYRGLTAEWFLPKNMAKLEGRLAELASPSAQRMVELAGEPAEMQTLFVGGLKRLPITYEIA